MSRAAWSSARVRIFRREDDDGIDRKAKLHQLAGGAEEQRGRKPGLLPRYLAEANHRLTGACSRARAWSRAEHGRTPGSTRLHAGAAAGGPGNLGGQHARVLTGRSLHLSPARRELRKDQVHGRRQAVGERYPWAIAEREQFHDVGTAARRAADGGGAWDQLDLGPAWAAMRCASPAMLISSVVPI